MAIRFSDASTGNDANDGFDNIGVGLATATWTEGTLTLTQSGHGYTFATGDVIYLIVGTGLTSGLYEVASSTSNTIVIVETSTLPDVGNGSDIAAGDDGTGDWESSSGPCLTIQANLTALSAGDHVWVRNTAAYGEALTTTTAGTNTAEVKIEGYGTSLGDGGIAVNDGANSLTNGWVPNVGSNFYVWKNFRFTQFTVTGFGSIVGDYITMINIRSDNNGSSGVLLDQYCYIYGCYFHNNGGDGINCDSNPTLLNCVINHNAGDGIMLDIGFVCNCLFFSNAGIAINFILNGDQSVVNCTIDGDGKDTATGIRFTSNFARLMCVNTIIYDCVNGIVGSAGSGARRISFNNLVNNCTTPYADFGTDEGEVTDAPDFVNEGTDYTPGSSSPAKNTGADLSTVPWGFTITGQRRSIGCFEAASTGAGGGLLMPNKRAGKQ